MLWISDAKESEQRPTPRWGHKVVAISPTELLLFGGNGDIFLSDVWVYTAAKGEGTWRCVRTSGATPVGRCGASLSALPSGDVVLLGGWGGGDVYLPMTVYILHTGTWIWETVEVKGEEPIGRTGHAAVTCPSGIVLFGGECLDSGSMEARKLDDAFFLNTDTWEWQRLQQSGDIPAARCGHAMELLSPSLFGGGGSSFILFGGTGESGEPSDDIFVGLCQGIAVPPPAVPKLSGSPSLPPRSPVSFPAGPSLVWQRVSVKGSPPSARCFPYVLPLPRCMSCQGESRRGLLVFGGFNGAYLDDCVAIEIVSTPLLKNARRRSSAASGGSSGAGLERSSKDEDALSSQGESRESDTRPLLCSAISSAVFFQAETGANQPHGCDGSGAILGDENTAVLVGGFRGKPLDNVCKLSIGDSYLSDDVEGLKRAFLGLETANDAAVQEFCATTLKTVSQQDAVKSIALRLRLGSGQSGSSTPLEVGGSGRKLDGGVPTVTPLHLLLDAVRSSNTVVQEAALEAIGHIATNDGNIELIVEGGTVSLLISLLVAIPSTSYGARGEFDDRNSVRERKKQKKKRFRIGDKKKNNKTDQPIASTSEQLIAEGEEEPYDLELDMETQVNHSIGRLCLWILSILTSHPKAASEFMSSEGLPTVVELLKSRDQGVAAAAAKCLSLLCALYPSCVPEVLSHGVIPTMVQLLQKSDFRVGRRVLQLFDELLRDPPHQLLTFEEDVNQSARKRSTGESDSASLKEETNEEAPAAVSVSGQVETAQEPQQEVTAELPAPVEKSEPVESSKAPQKAEESEERKPAEEESGEQKTDVEISEEKSSDKKKEEQQADKISDEEKEEAKKREEALWVLVRAARKKFVESDGATCLLAILSSADSEDQRSALAVLCHLLEKSFADYFRGLCESEEKQRQSYEDVMTSSYERRTSASRASARHEGGDGSEEMNEVRATTALNRIWFLGRFGTPAVRSLAGKAVAKLSSLHISLSVNLRHWTAVEVLEWLSHLELSQYAPAFEGAQIDGAMLRTLSEEDLMVLIPSETDRERLMKHLKDVILENPDEIVSDVRRVQGSSLVTARAHASKGCIAGSAMMSRDGLPSPSPASSLGMSVAEMDLARLQTLPPAELAANILGLRSAVDRLNEIAAMQARTITAMRQQHAMDMAELSENLQKKVDAAMNRQAETLIRLQAVNTPNNREAVEEDTKSAPPTDSKETEVKEEKQMSTSTNSADVGEESSNEDKKSRACVIM